MIRAIITYQRFAFTAVVQRSSLGFFRVLDPNSHFELQKSTAPLNAGNLQRGLRGLNLSIASISNPQNPKLETSGCPAVLPD